MISVMSRPDRYITSDFYGYETPKSKLKYSKFLKRYNAFDHDDLDSDEVYNCLPNHWQVTKGPYKGKPVDDLYFKWTKNDQIYTEKACIKLWTVESPVYRKLTQSLYEDHENNLKDLMPLISGMNQYIKSHPTKQEMKCYRGSSMTHKQFGHYRKGNIYRAPAFAAMTEDLELSQHFKKNAKITMIFNVPKNCHNAAKIGHINVWKENEVLSQPFTAFKVLDKGQNWVYCQILNNRKQRDDVESIFI